MDKELNTNKNNNQAMLKICGFIVDKRNLFFLLFGLLIIFSAISRNWVGVENSMAPNLPKLLYIGFKLIPQIPYKIGV